MLRDFKFRASVISIDKNIEIEAQEFNLDMSDCIEIPVYDITPDINKKKLKFNRAKTKQKTRQLIEEELQYELD